MNECLQLFNSLSLSCGEVVLQAQNLAAVRKQELNTVKSVVLTPIYVSQVFTGGGLSTAGRRTLYKYVGDDFLVCRFCRF